MIDLSYKKQANQEPKPISGTLNQRYLAKIVAQAKKINRLNSYLKQYIAPQWAPYYHVLNLKGNTLIIGVQSSGAAERFRWASADWLMALQQGNWPYIKHIEFKVTLNSAEDITSIKRHKQQQKIKKHTISPKTGKAYASHADHMPTQLQAAWQRLSEYLSQESE